MSPTKEEIRDECNRGIRVSVKPVDNWILEIGEGVNERVVSGVTDITDILCTFRYFWV